MEMFTAQHLSTKMWFELENFKSSWAIGVELDRVVQRAVEFRLSVQAFIGSAGTQISMENLFELGDSGISIARDLDTAAAEIDFLESTDVPLRREWRTFNNLFTPSNKTTQTIAASLYRSVSLSLLETMLDIMLNMQSRYDHCDNLNALVSQYNETTKKTLEGICQDIRTVFAVDGESSTYQRPGIPYRTFWMLWPMTAVMTSSIAGRVQKVWVRDKLQGVGETSGLGLVTMVAKLPL